MQEFHIAVAKGREVSPDDILFIQWVVQQVRCVKKCWEQWQYSAHINFLGSETCSVNFFRNGDCFACICRVGGKTFDVTYAPASEIVVNEMHKFSGSILERLRELAEK